MKNISSFFLLVLFCTQWGYGQIVLKPAIGINVSRYNTDPIDNYGEISGRTGWQFGAGLLVGKKFYFEPAFFFLQQGSELQTVDANSQEIKFKNDISSFYISAFGGYNILGKGKSFAGLRVFGGPSLQMVTKVSSEIPDISEEDFNTPIWAMNVGLGLDIWLIFFDVSYQWDLSNTYVNDDTNTRNQVLRANLGARIRF